MVQKEDTQVQGCWWSSSFDFRRILPLGLFPLRSLSIHQALSLPYSTPSKRKLTTFSGTFKARYLQGQTVCQCQRKEGMFVQVIFKTSKHVSSTDLRPSPLASSLYPLAVCPLYPYKVTRSVLLCYPVTLSLSLSFLLCPLA